MSASSWNVVSQLLETAPAAAPAAVQAPGTATEGIDSLLIAAASGGFFRTQPDSGQSATADEQRKARQACSTGAMGNARA